MRLPCCLSLHPSSYLLSRPITPPFLHVCVLRFLRFLCCCVVSKESRFEVFTLVTMKNAVFWDVPHRKHITSPLQSLAGMIWGSHGSDYEECRLLGCYVVWLLQEPTFRRNVAPPYHIVFLRSVRRLLVTANVFPSSPIPVTLMMDALRSSETSDLTRATRRNIQGDDILYRLLFIPRFSWSVFCS
jgi:hypothetical protein